MASYLSLSPGIPRFLIIGVGPFAKRIYIPHLIKLQTEGQAILTAAVDIEQNRKELEDYHRESCPDVELLLVEPFTSSMPILTEAELTNLVIRHQVSCVIISTEPLAHRAYGLWALGLGLNIIMDKPITTRLSVNSSMSEAIGIADDYCDLLKSYDTLQKYRKTCFLVNSHRRYHAGFQKTIDLVKEIRLKTGCPVTSINSSHCDGQWRLPTEIIRQEYHTYNRGYGKVSHSGYHAIDCVYQFIKAGIDENKQPDKVEVVSSFVQPRGFLVQLNEKDYHRLFGAQEYGAACQSSESELHRAMKDFGEIDAAIDLTFYRRNEAIALVHLDLQHNGFARRTWLKPGTDLYKGNGRARHEMHDIKSGPFQTLVINSRQASDRHETIHAGDTAIGGTNHFDIQAFRNCGMLGELNPLQTFTIEDFCQKATKELYSKSVKHAIVDECIDFMKNTSSLSILKSNLSDHSIPAHLMSAIYVSNLRRKSGLSPIVALELSFQDGIGSAYFAECYR